MLKKSLVIGINNYQHFSTLSNSVNDAEDIHSLLSSIGFDSTLLIDSNQTEMRHGLAAFKKSLSDDTVSLIYFSGHGLQDDRHNFLVNADSHVQIREDIPYNCTSADDLLITPSKNSLHIVILDACRNNPFYDGTRGFTVGLEKMEAPGGTFIAFSTSPNAVSIERTGERNGIYTKSLLKNMQEANVPIELIFKKTRNNVIHDTAERQVPWEESSLRGDHFYFVSVEEENIESKISLIALEDRNIELPELMPFLYDSSFNSMSLDMLMVSLTLIKISFSHEQEGVTKKTIDEDYFNDELFGTYYPKFQKRLEQEDNATEVFDVGIFDSIVIEKGENFGYNSLEDPEESFPQMMANHVKYNGQKGILNFFLSTQNDQHFLKPAIIIQDDKQLKVISYAIITGDKVNEILERYFEMRKPFEKVYPDLESYMTSIEMSDEEAKKWFGH